MTGKKGKGVEGLDKIKKKDGGGREYSGGGLHIIRGSTPLCQLCKETSHRPHYKTNPPFLASSISSKKLKIFHPPPNPPYSHF